MNGKNPTLVAVASLPTMVITFVIAFVAFVCWFALLEPDGLDVIRWALRSRQRIPDPADPAAGSSEDNHCVQQQALGEGKLQEQQLLRRQRETRGTTRRASDADQDDAEKIQRRAPPVLQAKHTLNRNHKKHYLVENATLRFGLHLDLRAVGFSVPLEDATPLEAPTCLSSIPETSCEAIKLVKDACELDAAISHHLSAAGFLEDVRPLLTGKQQGRETASLTWRQDTNSFLSDAPTRPTLSPTSCQATKLGFDSCEEHIWSELTTHSEEYYVRDLHLESSRILAIANKFLRYHTMQIKFNQLSSDTVTKPLSKVPVEPNQFRPHRHGQNYQVPRCFVEESRVVLALLPSAAIGRGYFKTMAKSINARHASHTTLPSNPCTDGTCENHDSVRPLVVKRLPRAHAGGIQWLDTQSPVTQRKTRLSHDDTLMVARMENFKGPQRNRNGKKITSFI